MIDLYHLQFSRFHVFCTKRFNSVSIPMNMNNTKFQKRKSIASCMTKCSRKNMSHFYITLDLNASNDHMKFSSLFLIEIALDQ